MLDALRTATPLSRCLAGLMAGALIGFAPVSLRGVSVPSALAQKSVQRPRPTTNGEGSFVLPKVGKRNVGLWDALKRIFRFRKEINENEKKIRQAKSPKERVAAIKEQNRWIQNQIRSGLLKPKQVRKVVVQHMSNLTDTADRLYGEMAKKRTDKSGVSVQSLQAFDAQLMEIEALIDMTSTMSGELEEFLRNHGVSGYGVRQGLLKKINDLTLDDLKQKVGVTRGSVEAAKAKAVATRK